MLLEDFIREKVGMTATHHRRVWKAPGWASDQLHYYTENHISHRPLTGRVSICNAMLSFFPRLILGIFVDFNCICRLMVNVVI